MSFSQGEYMKLIAEMRERIKEGGPRIVQGNPRLGMSCFDCQLVRR
jgi:hypothetical protein